MFGRNQDLLRENAALKEQLASVGKECADLRAENDKLRVGYGQLSLAFLDERAIEETLERIARAQCARRGIDPDAHASPTEIKALKNWEITAWSLRPGPLVCRTLRIVAQDQIRA